MKPKEPPVPMQPAATGFRRRILIEPAPGRVVAELEDDWHRMVVGLVHDGEVVLSVEAEMKRWPWSSCRGAIDVVSSTFIGQRIADVARSGLRTSNCTHLYDLALFAAAHADDAESTAYDIQVSDLENSAREALLRLNGQSCMHWKIADDVIVHPAELDGRQLRDLGDWIAGLSKRDKEAARILRWATIMAQGRGMTIPAGLEATAFPPGACFTFQPENARYGRRQPDAHTDFSNSKSPPMADRNEMFDQH